MASGGIERETRLDIIRGFAMLVIAINHVSVAFRIYGLEYIDIPTPTHLGYSSSAATFVAMSGYMVGFVYSRRRDGARAVLQRARMLYVYNLLLFLVTMPLLALMSPHEASSWHAETLQERPWLGLLQFLTLLRAPALLDVLQLYVILMILTPAALWLHRRSATSLVALSVGVWALCQLAAALRLFDPKIFEWNFNPAAWQIVFFLPMVFGSARGHEITFRYFHRNWIAVAALFTAVIAFALLKVLHVEQAIPDYALLTSKGNMGALRLMHAALIMFFYGGLLALVPALSKIAPLRALACIGRHTLPCYVVSAWLTYALAAVWSRYSGAYTTYLLAAAFSAFMTFVVASLADARRKRRTAAAMMS